MRASLIHYGGRTYNNTIGFSIIGRHRMYNGSDFNYDLWRLMDITRNLIYKLRERELAKYKVSMSAVIILQTIMVLDEKAIQARIAEYLFLEPHTVSEMLSKMEEKGLINRVKDQKSKNMIRIEITEKGHDLYIKSSQRESYNEILSVLNDNEKSELWTILSKLRKKAVENLDIEESPMYPPLDSWSSPDTLKSAK
jgi:DNA-binding MarR family transcriptional regulator